MRKLIVSFVFSIFLLSGNGWGATYYVDQTSGNDSAAGTSTGTAWKTISKINGRTFVPGDYILLKKGEMWRETLTIPSSGTIGNPITFSSYGTGDKPILQPTTLLSSWTQSSGNIYYASFATVPTQVFVNNVFVQPSHWPVAVGNSTPTFQYPSSNSGNTTTLIDTDLAGKASADLIGSVLHLYWSPWRLSSTTVTDWNGTTNTLTMGAAGANPDTSMRYYLSNVGPGMMTEGTWYYDSASQRVYLWKTGGGSPSSNTVEVSTSARGIYSNNRSYVTIDGINVKFSGGDGIYLTNLNVAVGGLYVLNSQVDYPNGTGIKVYWSASGYPMNNTLISGNTINYPKHDAITSGSASESCGDIKNNTITGASGMYPRLPGGITSDGYGDAAIWLRNNGCTVDNNTIIGSSNVGIYAHGNNTIISNNVVTNACTLLSDCGGLYSVPNGITAYGNIITNSGNGMYADEVAYDVVFRNNRINGGANAAIGMLLHRAYRFSIYGNVFTGPFGYAFYHNNHETSGAGDVYYNVVNCAGSGIGMQLSDASNLLTDVYNNTIANCSTGLGVYNASSVASNIRNNILYNNTTHISARTGNIAGTVSNNLYYPDTGTRFRWNGTAYNFANWKTNSGLDANSPTPADPLFLSSSDFRLQAGSPAINAGINVGLTTDYLGNAIVLPPDIGAYEYTFEYRSVYPKIPKPPEILRISP